MELVSKFKNMFSNVPMLGWLLGAFVAVLIEFYLGYDYISYVLGLPKIPVLFGTLIMLKEPIMIPSALAYDLIVYILPVLIVAKASTIVTNPIAMLLEKMPLILSAILHLAFFYSVLHLWAGINH